MTDPSKYASLTAYLDDREKNSQAARIERAARAVAKWDASCEDDCECGEDVYGEAGDFLQEYWTELVTIALAAADGE